MARRLGAFARVARGALVLAAIACTAFALPARAAAAPAITLSERLIDFGMAAPGERLVRELAVTSSGDAPLEIIEMRAFSDAVTAEAGATAIAPGDSTRVRIALAPAEAGLLETKLIVKTNALDESVVVIVVKADVAPWYAIDLTGRRVGEVRAGDDAVAAIALTLRDGAGLQFAGAKSTSPIVRVSPRPTPDGAHTVIDVSIADRAPAGAFECFAEVVVAGARNDTLRIAISGVVLGRWRAVPNPFHISRTRFSSARPPMLLCERTVDAPGRVLDLSTTVPGFAARLVPGEEGRSYRVALSPIDGWKAGTYEGEVRLKTDDPKEPLVIVPTTVFVGKAGAQ
ncbi:MAG: DUF1573 domain-containing protein [bacterium]